MSGKSRDLVELMGACTEGHYHLADLEKQAATVGAKYRGNKRAIEDKVAGDFQEFLDTHFSYLGTLERIGRFFVDYDPVKSQLTINVTRIGIKDVDSGEYGKNGDRLPKTLRVAELFTKLDGKDRYPVPVKVQLSYDQRHKPPINPTP